MGKIHKWEEIYYEMEVAGAGFLSFNIFQYFICCYEVLKLKTEISNQTSAEKYGLVTGKRS